MSDGHYLAVNPDATYSKEGYTEPRFIYGGFVRIGERGFDFDGVVGKSLRCRRCGFIASALPDFDEFANEHCKCEGELLPGIGLTKPEAQPEPSHPSPPAALPEP